MNIYENYRRFFVAAAVVHGRKMKKNTPTTKLRVTKKEADKRVAAAAALNTKAFKSIE